MAEQSYSESSDPALVVAVARYHEGALAELYRRHAGSVHALARRLLGDPALAEEIVQEVFLRLWREPERFDAERGSVRSFLLTHTHGRSVDLVRAESSRRRREERDQVRTPDVGYDLEREVMDLAVAERVRTALAVLNQQERAAIELAYLGGCTYREVATVLQEPEGTIKSRIRSGMQKLRGELGDLVGVAAR